MCTRNGINSLSKVPLDYHDGFSKIECERTVGMSHAGTSKKKKKKKTDVKIKLKFEHLKVKPCVKSLTLRRKR